LAKVDQWKYSGDSLIVTLDPGPLIHWADLSFRALEFLPTEWVSQLDESGEIVNYKNWRANVEQVLKAAQSDGYLFATYDLEVRALINDSLYGEIVFDPGLRIILDSIDNKGTAKLSSQFLYRTIAIRKGEPVTPDHLKVLQQQLNNLRFVQQTSPPVLILIDEKATVRAYLDNRNASSFDILAGFQPSNDPEKSFSLTGYAQLELVNQLTRGERIFLHLEKLRPRSQELEMALSYPFLFDLPFGVEGEFRLLKNDTLYSELEWKAGISMPLGRNQFMRAGVTQLSTNIIGVDINRVLSSKRLPPYVDLRVKGFTLGLIRNRLDFELNPRRGYSVDIEGSFSQRRVRPNDLITRLNDVDTTFDYASLYDTLSDPSSRIVLETALQYFIPWGNRSTIRLAVDAGGIESGKRLFSNELFRLGGYARLRGFDEESILAQFYSVFSAEYRLIIGGGSYISLFGDYAWIKNVDVDLPLEDRRFGLGIGLNLETTAGIFGMRIAVGAQRGNAIDLDNTRVHLGYVNRF
jgi:outer membrane protein assembly factor BamA